MEEIMNFALRLSAHHLGIASCIGLIREACILQEILEANGFEVDSLQAAASSTADVKNLTDGALPGGGDRLPKLALDHSPTLNTRTVVRSKRSK